MPPRVTHNEAFSAYTHTHTSIHTYQEASSVLVHCIYIFIYIHTYISGMPPGVAHSRGSFTAKTHHKHTAHFPRNTDPPPNSAARDKDGGSVDSVYKTQHTYTSNFPRDTDFPPNTAPRDEDGGSVDSVYMYDWGGGVGVHVKAVWEGLMMFRKSVYVRVGGADGRIKVCMHVCMCVYIYIYIYMCVCDSNGVCMCV
jgi:hypothetical protein